MTSSGRFEHALPTYTASQLDQATKYLRANDYTRFPDLSHSLDTGDSTGVIIAGIGATCFVTYGVGTLF